MRIKEGVGGSPTVPLYVGKSLHFTVFLPQQLSWKQAF